MSAAPECKQDALACGDDSAIPSPAPLLARADSIDSLMCPDNECLDRLLQSPASSNTVMTDDHATSSEYTSSAAVQLPPLPGDSLRGVRCCQPAGCSHRQQCCQPARHIRYRQKGSQPHPRSNAIRVITGCRCGFGTILGGPHG